MLSNTCKYALRATIYIALKEEENKKIGLKKIAEELDIPSPFLGKILQTLAKKRLLNSTKGPNGGFGLGKKSEEITIIDIVEIIDGLEYFKTCLIGLQSCTDDPENHPCSTHHKYSPIRDQVYSLFKNTTIKSLTEDIDASEGFINI